MSNYVYNTPYVLLNNNMLPIKLVTVYHSIFVMSILYSVWNIINFLGMRAERS